MSTVAYIGSTNAPRELSLYFNSRDGHYPTPRSSYNPDTERYTTSNDYFHTDVEFTLTNPLAFGHDVDTLLSCTSVCVPHSFYNITAGINDCIYFSVLLWQGPSSTAKQFRAIVQPGNYDPVSFAAAVQVAMNVALLKAVPTALAGFVFDITVTYSPVRHKLFFNFGPKQSINYPIPPPFAATLTCPSVVPFSKEKQVVTFTLALTGSYEAPLTINYEATLFDANDKLVKQYASTNIEPTDTGCLVSVESPPSSLIPNTARYLEIQAYILDKHGRAIEAEASTQLNKEFDNEITTWSVPDPIVKSGTFALEGEVTGDSTAPVTNAWLVTLTNDNGVLLPKTGAALVGTGLSAQLTVNLPQIDTDSNSGRLAVYLTSTDSANPALTCTTSKSVAWQREPFKNTFYAVPAGTIVNDDMVDLTGSLSGDYLQPVTTTWVVKTLTDDGIVIPGEKAVVLNQYDLNATIKPSLNDINYATLQTGKFEIIMTSTDLTGKVAVKSLEIPWSRAFKTTIKCDVDRLLKDGTYTWAPTNEGIYKLPVTYRFTSVYFSAAGVMIPLAPAGLINATTGELVFDYSRSQAGTLKAARITVSCEATDANGLKAPQVLNSVPIGPAPLLGDIDPAATVRAVRLTFLPQGVPYTGPGARPDTTTLNAGMFVEPGFRRDVASYMQIGTTSMAPVTAADVDGRWTDFTSEPPQLLDAPLPGMPTPHALDLHANMHNLYVRTSLTPDSSMSSMEGGRGSQDRIVDFSNILTCISTTDTKPGDVISNTVPMWDHPSRLQLSSFTNIRVELTDSRNQLVDLQGCHWSIVLRLAFIVRNARKMPLSKLESRFISSVHERGATLNKRLEFHAKNIESDQKAPKPKKKKNKKPRKRNAKRAVSGPSSGDLPVSTTGPGLQAAGAGRDPRLQTGARAEEEEEGERA